MTGFDRRAAFFAMAATACFLLIPVAGSDFGALTIGLGLVYAALALASWADHRSRFRR